MLFQCDNTGVVAAVKKGSSKEVLVVHLSRALWFFAAHYNVNVSIEHIVGVSDMAADHLSRFNMQSFFLSDPQAELLPTPLPQALLQLVAVSRPDWTSPTFRQSFSIIMNRA